MSLGKHASLFYSFWWKERKIFLSVFSILNINRKIQKQYLEIGKINHSQSLSRSPRAPKYSENRSQNCPSLNSYLLQLVCQVGLISCQENSSDLKLVSRHFLLKMGKLSNWSPIFVDINRCQDLLQTALWSKRSSKIMAWTSLYCSIGATYGQIKISVELLPHLAALWLILPILINKIRDYLDLLKVFDFGDSKFPETSWSY